MGQGNSATGRGLRLGALAASMALASCGGRETVGVSVPDATAGDATAGDAGAPAASARDASAPRSPPRDASVPGSSTPDATARDATTHDAVARDASPTIDGTGPTLSTAAQLASWDAALDAASCDAEERCAVEVGPLYASRVDCTRSSSNEWYSRFWANLSHYEPIAKLFTLATESVRKACLDALRNRPCSESRWPAECDAALVPLNPLAENAACSVENGWTPNVPCAAGLECNTGEGTCGVCGPSPLLPVGASCSGANEDCQSFFCDPKTHTCRPSSERRGVGMPCSQFECLPRLTCVGPTGQRVCTRYAKEGEPCAGWVTSVTTLPPCVLGLTCMGPDPKGPGQCENEWLPDGAPCQRVQLGQAGSAPNSCRAFCIFPSADAQQGICGSSWPEQGDFPCLSYIIGDGTECPESHYSEVVLADGSVTKSCVCHPRKANGSSCSTHAECTSRRCTGPGSVKTCTTPATYLGRCVSDSDCTSGYCNPLTSWCDNPAYLCPPRAQHDGGGL